MTFRRTAGITVLTSIISMLGACGEEVRAPQGARGEKPDRPACEWIAQVDLEQIFVNRLKPAAEVKSSMSHCIWTDVQSGQPFVEYELHPYQEDLQAGVNSLEQEMGRNVNPRYVQGIGDEAVWTDVGLFVNRNGRTLQVQPLQEDQNRAPYQELARLLLTRLEGR